MFKLAQPGERRPGELRLLWGIIAACVLAAAPAMAVAVDDAFDPFEAPVPREDPSPAPPAPVPGPQQPQVEELPEETDQVRPPRTLPVVRHSANRLLADQLAALAGQAVVTPEPGRPYQRRIAVPLLDHALELARRDAQLWHRRALMLDPDQERAELMQALERYCQLEPTDDAARLRLIELDLEPLQGIDQRIAHIETLLADEDGPELSQPLQSRLHTFLAEAARELGDDVNHRQHLRQALRLDRANKQASAMVYQLLRDRDAPPLHLGVALWGVIRADPFDPDPRRRIADVLLSKGAYQAALAQYEVVSQLRQQMPSARLIYNWVSAAAGSGEVDFALTLLTNYQNQLWQMQRERDREDTQRPASDGAGRVLPLNLHRLRALLMLHFEEEDELGVVLTHIERALRRERGDGAAAELAWLRIMYRQVAPDDERPLRELIEAFGEDHTIVHRARGWLAWQRGQWDEARGHLEQVRDDALAAYALARIAQSRRRPRDEAIDLLQRAVSADPRSEGALLAAMQLGAMNVNVALSAEARHLADIPMAWPQAIKRPGLSPERLVEFRLEVEPEDRVAFLDPITAVLRLRNTTSVPLSLAGGVLPEAVALQTEVRYAGQRLPALPLMVVSIGRRLTLGPGEEVELPVRLDHGPLGELLYREPWRSASFSVTATLNPYQDQRGTIQPGPMGHEARVFVRVRQPMVSDADLNTMAMRALDRDEGGQRMLSLAILSSFTRRAVDAIDQVERTRRQAIEARAEVEQIEDLESLLGDLRGELRRVADFLNDRFRDMDEREQAWVVRFTAPVALRPAPWPLNWQPQELGDAYREPLAPIAAAAADSDRPLVRMTYMATWVVDPGSDLLAGATQDPDPRIAAFARARIEALTEMLEIQHEIQQAMERDRQ